jgi:hypothetical protein
VSNRWEFRTGGATTSSSNTVQKNVFYHVEMEADFAGKIFDGVATGRRSRSIRRRRPAGTTTATSTSPRTSPTTRR